MCDERRQTTSLSQLVIESEPTQSTVHGNVVCARSQSSAACGRPETFCANELSDHSDGWMENRVPSRIDLSRTQYLLNCSPFIRANILSPLHSSWFRCGECRLRSGEKWKHHKSVYGVIRTQSWWHLHDINEWKPKNYSIFVGAYDSMGTVELDSNRWWRLPLNTP